MKISTTVVSTALLAGAVLAHPSGAYRSSRPPQKSSLTDGEATTQTDSNWAGAVLTAPSDQAFYGIIGSFTVPEPNPPTTKAEGPWFGSAWVGIDGFSSSTPAILQAGVSWNVSIDETGKITRGYSAWHEWFPDESINFDNFEVNAGDIITVLCEANSSSAGFCELQNDNTGIRVSIDMRAPPDMIANLLVGQNAEWIVEDFSMGFNLVPFANFSKVEWFNCKADTAGAGFSGGKTTSFYPNSNATIVDIGQNGVSLASAVVSGDDVSITYTG